MILHRDCVGVRAMGLRRILLITIHIWHREVDVLNLLKPTRITLCNDFSLHYLEMAAVNEDRFHGAGQVRSKGKSKET